MQAPLLRRAGRAASERLIYRLDQLLTFPPLVQVAVLLLLTAILISGFAALALTAYPGDASFPNATERTCAQVMANARARVTPR